MMLLLACSAGSAALLTPRIASAFPVEVQVISKVSVGKAPKLVVHATSDAKQATIELKRDDGRMFTFALGNLSTGQEKEVLLDSRQGRHEYSGKMKAVVDGEEMDSPLSFSTVVAQPLQIRVTKDDLDLEKQKLRFVANREVAFATLKVIGIDGGTISENTHQVSGSGSGQPIELSFGPINRDALLRLELRVEDEDGFYRALSLTPWSVHIPHEEVLFATNSAEVAEDQVHKLEESLEKIRTNLKRYHQIRGVQLFIAGHTDTKGKASHNRELSRRRAQAIAAWFVQNGIGIKVLYEGFGESLLKVKTKDEVDEAQNRRVDYILSVERPPIVGGAWRALN